MLWEMQHWDLHAFSPVLKAIIHYPACLFTDSISHRVSVRKELAGDKEWVETLLPTFLPLLQSQVWFYPLEYISRWAKL